MAKRPKPGPHSARNSALGGAAITTLLALMLVEPAKKGWRPNVVFVGGMAIVGAITGAALSVSNG